MCGINGIVARRPVEDRSWLLLARDAMKHRGPDGAGSWWSSDGCAGLGHRRLAIIDLSPAGHQPMRDSSGELCIVFNGEIYNYLDLRAELAARGHTFVSSSDTEAILAAYRQWGNDCVVRLNGMFAFALYDGRKRSLLLARDRAGEKPLYYKLADGSLEFASELKGLMANPQFTRRINPEALDCYLTMGFVPGNRCILDGVCKLPPAHALSFDLQSGESKLWRYWQLPEAVNGSGSFHGEEELVDELEVLLADAVRRQLVADVPVGVLLSGGTDSSLITAMAARAAPKLKTFTVRFPGYGKYDETEHARRIARHFGTDHSELDAADSSTDLLPLLARQFDEPLNDSSMVPTYLVSRLIREHCTVALGGDGGDELFGGYEHYHSILRIRRTLGCVPLVLRQLMAASAERLLPVGFKGRNWLQGLRYDWWHRVPLTSICFDRTTRRPLMAARNPWATVGEEILQASVPSAPDLLDRATRMDFYNFLPEDILVKVDRASMLNSLEVRAPLLDFRIIDFAFGKVPPSAKANGSGRKILLKRLAARVLPADFEAERKQGFSIPLAKWLEAGPWRKFFQETLLDHGSELFDRKVLVGLLEGQQRGRSNSERLFALVMFVLWAREYGVKM